MPVLLLFRIKIEFEVGGEFFHCTGYNVTVKGFTSIMPWMAVSEKNLPDFTDGEKIPISRLELDEVLFQSPKTEFEGAGLVRLGQL